MDPRLAGDADAAAAGSPLPMKRPSWISLRQRQQRAEAADEFADRWHVKGHISLSHHELLHRV
jgi:hypothetical protein